MTKRALKYILMIIIVGLPLTECSTDSPVDPDEKFAVESMSDIDGNVYRTVRIGTQRWMAENLRVTHYRDGTAILKVTDNLQYVGLTSGMYRYYNNDSLMAEQSGALYNWDAVNSSHILAPEGWHVPTVEEWYELTEFLGGSTRAGTKLKSGTGWVKNGNGTDEVGFDGIPTGLWYPYSICSGLDSTAYFWTSSEYNSTQAWSRGLLHYYSGLTRNYMTKMHALSVRCVRDEN